MTFALPASHFSAAFASSSFCAPMGWVGVATKSYPAASSGTSEMNTGTDGPPQASTGSRQVLLGHHGQSIMPTTVLVGKQCAKALVAGHGTDVRTFVRLPARRSPEFGSLRGLESSR